MKVETVEQTEDEVIELAKNREMKSLMDGSEPPAINDPEPKPTEEAEDEKPNDAQQENEVTEPTEKEQLQAALERIQKLERSLDKTNGTYGNELSRLKQQLAEVENKKREIVASITPAHFKRIREQYSDELATALIEDLTEAFSVPSTQQEDRLVTGIDPRLDAIAQSTEQLAGQMRQMARSELTRLHPDWNEVAAWKAENVDGIGNVIKWKSPAFGDWLDKQNEDIRSTVFASDDANAISQVLTKYKTEKNLQPQNPESNNQSPPDKTAIQKKLEKTVLPTGRRTGAHELLTDDEVIMKAAQEEQRRIMNGY